MSCRPTFQHYIAISLELTGSEKKDRKVAHSETDLILPCLHFSHWKHGQFRKVSSPYHLFLVIVFCSDTSLVRRGKHLPCDNG